MTITRSQSVDDEGTGAITAPVTRWGLNVIANYAGTIWTAVASLATIPLVIHFVGIAAYGLVGFWVALQAIVALADLGLSTALNRELATASNQPNWRANARDLLRTLEVVYWSLAAFACVAMIGSAPLIGSHWLHGPHGVNLGLVLVLIAATIALEFPFVLYAGGLLGLQRQIELNLVNIGAATLRTFGGLVILAAVSPTIEAFFAWQAIVSLAQSAATGWLLWRHLRLASHRPVCRFARLRGVASFSAALAVIGILSAALTQLPRLELSGLLSLRTFGYFSVATVAVSGLYALVTPVFQAVFPQLSNLLDTGSPRLAGVYHHACQLVSAVVLPVALVLIFFSRQILLVWTGSTDAANGTWLVLTLLAIGTGMHALYWIPYALQLAGKWTALALWQNSIAVAVLVPFTFVAAHQWGAPGAAAGWIALNAGYLTIGIHLMHRRLATGEQARWYMVDVLPPLVAAIGVTAGAWALLTLASYWPAGRVAGAALIGVITLTATVCAAASVPGPRGLIASRVSMLKPLLRVTHPAGEIA